jgi:hypothetical protein
VKSGLAEELKGVRSAVKGLETRLNDRPSQRVASGRK